jgi:peptide/nickel transport system substrate-binding protein
MPSSIRRVSVLVVVAIAIAACAPTAPSASSAAPANATPTAGPVGGTLVTRLSGDWASLDPFDPGTTNSNQVMAAVYDRLVTIENGKVVPYLAASWQQTPTSITFKLRTDATCADGSKVTANLVADNWRRNLDPKKPSQNAAQFLGPQPYTITADDTASTVSIGLSQPRGDAIYAFTGGFGSIVCPAGLANPTSLADTPSGSGPYTVVEAVHGDHITLKARPEWKWGPSNTTATTAGFPQELVYKVVTNETTAANLMLTGAMDVAIVKGQDVPRLRNDKTLTSQKALPYTADPLQMNEDPARPTADKMVRQALSMSIDPAGWNQAMNAGEGVLSTSVVTPNAPCFDAGTKNLAPAPDVNKARALLTSNGWTADASGKLSKGGKPLALKILGNTTQGTGPEYLLEQFTKLGVTATLDMLDFTTFAGKYRTSDFDVTVGNLSFAVPGPIQIVSYLSGTPPPAGRNFGRIIDPELEKAVAAAQATTGDEQCKNWATVQERLLSEAHVLPLAGQVTSVFARNGFSFSPTANNFLEVYLLRAPAK